MCGRYYFEPRLQAELAQLTSRAQQNGFQVKRGEIFPSDEVLVLVAQGQKVRAVSKTWGLSPSQNTRKLINARAETVLDKLSLREAFLNQRCIFPTSGFYEWDSHKRKIFFQQPDKEVLYLAGFYQNNQSIILTTVANDSVSPSHDRMPVILTKQDLRPWLTDLNFARNYLKKSMPQLISQPANTNLPREIDLFEK